MSDEIGVISHYSILPPDWNAIRSLDTREAADTLNGILVGMDGIEKQAFAVRGMCALLIEERELWNQFVDPEVGKPYASFDRFIKVAYPNSWSYVRDALRKVKELRDTPFSDLLQMPRCNIETLAKASSNVRKEPKVIEAAKNLSEAKFAEKLSRDYGQAIDTNLTLKVTLPAGEMGEVYKALDLVGKKCDVADRAGQLLALCIDFNLENAESE